MNSRDIAKYRKLLEQDVNVDKISKFLGVSKDTLKKFAPKKAAPAKTAEPAS
jgi:predicted transcriptional regulator